MSQMGPGSEKEHILSFTDLSNRHMLKACSVPSIKPTAGGRDGRLTPQPVQGAPKFWEGESSGDGRSEKDTPSYWQAGKTELTVQLSGWSQEWQWEIVDVHSMSHA